MHFSVKQPRRNHDSHSGVAKCQLREIFVHRPISSRTCYHSVLGSIGHLELLGERITLPKVDKSVDKKGGQGWATPREKKCVCDRDPSAKHWEGWRSLFLTVGMVTASHDDSEYVEWTDEKPMKLSRCMKIAEQLQV